MIRVLAVISAAVVAAGPLMLFLVWLQTPSDAQAPSGASPRDVLNQKTVAQIEQGSETLSGALRDLRDEIRSFGVQHSVMASRLSVLEQRVADLAEATGKRLDVQRGAIDALDPAKTAERVKALEIAEARRDVAQAAATADTKTWRDRMYSIAVGVFMILMGSVVGIFCNEWWKRKQRRAIHAVEAGDRAEIKRVVETVRHQTNDMTAHLVSISRAEGVIEGRVEADRLHGMVTWSDSTTRPRPPSGPHPAVDPTIAQQEFAGEEGC